VKYVDSFRDPDKVRRVADVLAARCTRPWKVMEICGGQTHTIARYGLDELLPSSLELVHGPGCPVCVTPLETIALAHALAGAPDVVLCSFGDMLRVPGPDGDLLAARARGADVRVVLSPLDAVELARKLPDRRVVFFAVGFETTAPATAMSIELAQRLGLTNYSVLASHVRVPPAMELLLSSPDNEVRAFLAAGHVCTVTGTSEYPSIAERHGVPVVVTGFEPLDILLGLLDAVTQLEDGRAEVSNRYRRAVGDEGNPRARALVEQIFEVADVPWRGLGIIAQGGLRIRPSHRRFDATHVHPVAVAAIEEPSLCVASEILQGRRLPVQCPAFGRECTPQTPLGAPMVSSEGACAAYYRYRATERR